MRKSPLFFLFQILIVLSASAQNLISNPGFEEYTKRPNKTSQWHLVKGWGAIDVGSVSPNTPDWYSLKAGGADVRLPHVSWAKAMTLYPKEGNAVAGFIALSNNGIHEYITNTLTRKISKGERVQCSFYYTNGADAPVGKNKARLGVYFSTTFPVSSTHLLQVKPQSQMSKPQFSNEWKLYEVDFIAEEEYSFMTIGCFDEPYDRTLYAKASEKGSFGDWAYYFIDGVTVRTDADSLAMPEVHVPEKEKINIEAVRFIFKTEDTKERIKVTGQIFNHSSVHPTDFRDAEVLVTAGQAEGIKVIASAEGYFPISEIINRDSVLKSETKTHTFYLSPVRKGSTIVLNHIYFNTGSPVLLPTSFAELDRLIELLQANPDMEILISGHTDNLGDPEKDLVLSEERAQNVKQYLIDKGIRAGRLSAKGYGVTQPIADNRTPLGRSKNRRVEFSIIK